MITIKKINHIDETKLDRNESILFIDLLKTEMIRHKCAMHRAHEQMYYDVGCINSVFWKCQKENHKQDVEKIENCIIYLIKKWRII